MKIFFLGHFGSYGGFGQASRDYVELLLSNGHEVTCQSIDPQESVSRFGQVWVERCSLPSVKDSYDVFFVHKSPWNYAGRREDVHSMQEFEQAKKKYYITIFETDLWPSNWKPLLEPFDGVITASQWQKRACIKMMGPEWEPRTHLVPHVVEPRLPLPPRHDDGSYTFYSEFSQIIHRKGLDILLAAYFMAFSASDKVKLVLKIPGNPAEIMKFEQVVIFASDCFNWKELPMVETCRAWLNDNQMDQLMMDSNCYICSARGEGFSIPLAKAAVNGRKVVYPAKGGLDWGGDFCDGVDAFAAIGWPVITDSFAAVEMKLETTGMKWIEPEIMELAERMQWCYLNRALGEPRTQEKARSLLSKEAVYTKLMEAINA